MFSPSVDKYLLVLAFVDDIQHATFRLGFSLFLLKRLLSWQIEKL